MRGQSPERPDHTGGGTSEGLRPRPQDGDPRFAQLVARLGERLRPVCAGWDEDRFQALVLRIARMKAQWGELDRVVAHPDE